MNRDLIANGNSKERGKPTRSSRIRVNNTINLKIRSAILKMKNIL